MAGVPRVRLGLVGKPRGEAASRRPERNYKSRPQCIDCVRMVHEMRDKSDAAYASYRAALIADPDYEPARLHLMKYFNDRLM